MYICVNDPSLNRNFGKYQLPHTWMRFYRIHHHFSSNNIAVKPIHLPTWANPRKYTIQQMGHMQLQLVSIVPIGGAFLLPISSSTISIMPPTYPKHPMHPKLSYTSISKVPSLVSTYFDLCSLTFFRDLMK